MNSSFILSILLILLSCQFAWRDRGAAQKPALVFVLIAAEPRVRGDVQRAAVVAEGAVRNEVAGRDRAEVLACGRDHEHAAGAGGEQVAVGVDLEAVGRAGLAGADQAVASKNTFGSPSEPSSFTGNARQQAASLSDWPTYRIFSSGENARPLGLVIRG